MSRFSHEINSMARELSREELLSVCEKWIQEQERWDNSPTSGYYMEDGSYGDLFLQHVQNVDPINRVCFVVDLSQFSRPVKYIEYLPKIFPTEQQAVEYYSKKNNFVW